MLTTKHGLAGWLLTAALACGTTNAALGQERVGGERPGGERGGAAGHHEVIGSLKSVDSVAGTITVSVTVNQRGERGGERRAPEMTDKTFTLAKNVEVVAGTGASAAGRGERGFGGGVVCKEVKLADLAVGVKISLSLSADQKSVECIQAEGSTIRAPLKSVDAAKKTLTIQMPGRAGGRGEAAVPGEEHTYTLLPDAEIAVDDGRGARFSVKEGKIADLAQGAIVTMKLHVDLKSIQSVLAEGPSHVGTIKAIDPAKRTLTIVVRPARGDDAGEEYQLAVSNEASILVNDGKGRRLSVKMGKLADIPVGAAAAVKLSADQVHIMSIQAQGLTVTAQAKSVDAAKGTITVVVSPGGRGLDPVEKTYSVAKDARISVDGKSSTLVDVKMGEGTSVTLHLSLDQQTVQAVTSQKASEGRR